MGMWEEEVTLKVDEDPHVRHGHLRSAWRVDGRCGPKRLDWYRRCVVVRLPKFHMVTHGGIVWISLCLLQLLYADPCTCCKYGG
jgi:hypothetical protein